jgi:hypothetical protein
VGWRINMLNYRGDRAVDRAALRNWFADQQTAVFERPTTPWRFGYGSDTLGFDAAASQVRDEVQGLLDSIRGAL